eukprot:scaffold1318_cov388-Prasinococcus_capsulatus_cf.AAC.9
MPLRAGGLSLCNGALSERGKNWDDVPNAHGLHPAGKHRLNEAERHFDVAHEHHIPAAIT